MIGKRIVLGDENEKGLDSEEGIEVIFDGWDGVVYNEWVGLIVLRYLCILFYWEKVRVSFVVWRECFLGI